MLEIAENLHRADLTVMERKLQEAEWIKLAGEEEGYAVQVAPHKDQPRKRGQKPGGINAAARELGIDRTEAHRAIKIAATAPEAQEYPPSLAASTLRRN